MRIKRLKLSLVVQYTRLSLLPPIPVYYPTIATEIYSTESKLIRYHNNMIHVGTEFELQLIRIGRIPKYLLISANISRTGSKEFPTGVDGDIFEFTQVVAVEPDREEIYGDVFQQKYLTTGGP